MRKKHLFMLPCIAAVAVATVFGAKSFQTVAGEKSNLLMENVEALSADAEGGGTGNTGPRQKYDCPGVFTGDGFNCACTNKFDCTPQEC